MAAPASRSEALRWEEGDLVTAKPSLATGVQSIPDEWLLDYIQLWLSLLWGVGQQSESFPTVVSSGLCGPRPSTPLYVLRGASRKKGRGGLWCTAVGLEMESRRCPARGQEPGCEGSGPSGEYGWPGLLA